MINYNYSYKIRVNNAYIITVKGNELSEKLSRRCAESCEKVNQPYKIYYGFDGTDKKNIIVPEELQNESWLKWIKLYTNVLSTAQIVCFYSHVSLWIKCLEIDEPIVILEHDAIMVKHYDMHSAWNSIVYLGSAEQVRDSRVYHIPPHGSSEDTRNRFICRAHAYAIDPAIAKNLLSHVIKNGICAPLDVTIRSDLFPIAQQGIYAYDEFSGSIIHKDWNYLNAGL